MMTIKKIFLFAAVILTSSCCIAQTELRVLMPINDSLKKNVHSVVRERSTVFEIKSFDKAYCRIHELITVLDATAKGKLRFSERTDKFNSLEDVSIVLYDALGQKIKKYTKKDLSSINDLYNGLVSDGKIYSINIPVASYPVHVEFDYELKFNGLLYYPSYMVQTVGESVENSSFTVIVPADLDIRYKEKNVRLAPEIITEKGNKIYTWSAKNKTGLLYEPESADYDSYCPSIIIAPNKFALDGYEGNMSSWEKYGEWYGALAKKSIDLPPARKQFFKTLVKDANTDREKAAIIYKYLQQNCRYVLISLGIGGWKPFEASFVDEKKYGDCKALSNYTQACLDAVGIKSYQALINAGYNEEPVDTAFSYHAFNHVILCIPMQKDSVWLECTSNTNEFGVLGSFTENRYALLITETSGKLVPTPKSIPSNNILRTFCTINIADDGSGVATVKMETKGGYKYHSLLTEKKDDQKDFIVNYLGFIQPDEFILTEKKDGDYEYKIEMNIEKIPSFTAGNKMFLNPRIYKICSSNLPDISKRSQDYYFHYPFSKDDTTIYHLPVGYTIEALPEAKKINFDYGNFKTVYSYDKDKNEVLSITHLELTNYHIPASLYEKTKIFFDAVLAEYNGKIVIKKTN